MINNAGFIPRERGDRRLTDLYAIFFSDYQSSYSPAHKSENEEDLLEQDLRAYFEVNTIGTIHVTNAFLPLLKAGKTKKVITISTGVADPDFIAKIGFSSGAPYAISKAAVNMAVTKYAIQFRDEDFTFVSISPGLVDTSEDREFRLFSVYEFSSTDENSLLIANPAHYKGYVSVFQKVKPTFQRPLTTQESVTFQLKTIERLSVEDTGAFISHHGSKDWL